MKLIYASVPNGLEQDAYNLMSNLERSNVISIDDQGYVTFSGKSDEVKLKDLLRAIFVCRARVSHIESFLTKILIHIDENLIKNEKLIKLSSDEKSIKHEYDSHTDDDSGEVLQYTLQDSALFLREQFTPKKNLYYWFDYDENLHTHVNSKIKLGNRSKLFSIFFIENELFIETVISLLRENWRWKKWSL